MLIEFSVENFRSIRTRQTLSMVASPWLRKKNNTVKVTIDGEPKFPTLLKVAAIYGPNASGKSSIVKALAILPEICHRNPSTDSQPFPVSPFRFDPELKDKPSVFEVHFIVYATRYSFKVALTGERVQYERLAIYKKGNEVELYERAWTKEGGDEYKLGDILEGGPEVLAAWKRLTGSQTLFISQAVANSSEDLKQLRRPFEWLKKLTVEADGPDKRANLTRQMIADFPPIGSGVANLLNEVDIPISGIRSKWDELPVNALRLPFGTRRGLTTTLMHKTSLGEADFDFDEESDGTKGLIGIAVMWNFFQNEFFGDDRRLFVIDEFDSSLHPKMVEALVERHIQNGLERQLIFTTHDTHLMDSKLLRRDQIWLTERDETGATQLRSVHDFEGREGEDIEKRYYEGRYRALPFIKKA